MNERKRQTMNEKEKKRALSKEKLIKYGMFVCMFVCLLRAFFSFIYSDAASLESTHTLTNETFNESNDACEMSDVITAPKRKKNNKQQETELNGECSNEALSQYQLTTSPSTSNSSSGKYPGSLGSGDIDVKDDDDDGDGDDDGKNTGKNLARYKRRNSNNNGNSISLPHTPLDTPMPRRREFTKKRNTNTTTNNAVAGGSSRRNNTISTDKDTFVQVKNAQTTCIDTNFNGRNKDSGSDDVATETKSVNGADGNRMSTRKKRGTYLNMVGSSSSNKVFEHDSERDSDSLASINKQRAAAASTSNKSDAMRRLSVSNATLRNVNVPTIFFCSCFMSFALAFPIHSFALIFMQIFSDKNRIYS